MEEEEGAEAASDVYARNILLILLRGRWSSILHHFLNIIRSRTNLPSFLPSSKLNFLPRFVFRGAFFWSYRNEEEDEDDLALPSLTHFFRTRRVAEAFVYPPRIKCEKEFNIKTSLSRPLINISRMEGFFLGVRSGVWGKIPIAETARTRYEWRRRIFLFGFALFPGEKIRIYIFRTNLWFADALNFLSLSSVSAVGWCKLGGPRNECLTSERVSLLVSSA